MPQNYFFQFSELPWWLLLIIIWSLIWKGIALWRAAKNNHLIWYIVLLILNTVGILEILYVFVFSKPKKLGEIPKSQVSPQKRGPKD